MRRRVLLVPMVLAVVAVALVGILQTGGGKDDELPPLSAQQVRERATGAPAPIAAVHAQGNELLGGGEQALRARLKALRGTPVVVNVWGAWCTPCREEMPILQHVAVEQAKTVAFLGIDTLDSARKASAFLRTVPVPYPSYQDLKGEIAAGLGLRGTPSTIFYDRSGKATPHQGVYRSKADFEADLRRYALRG